MTEIATEPIELGEIKNDDFISRLKSETERDKDPQEAQAPPPGSKEASGKKTVSSDDDDDDLDELSSPGLAADMLVEAMNIVHNVAMQAISGLPDPDAFKPPAQGVKRIKKAAEKLISKFNFNIHPGFAFIVLILVVYGPSTIKAVSMKKRNQQEKKKAAGIKVDDKQTVIEFKRPPGRPPGAKNKE